MTAFRRRRIQQSNETGDGGDGDSSSSGSSGGSSSDIEADEGSTADEEQDDNSLVSGIGDLNIIGGDVEDAGEMSPVSMILLCYIRYLVTFRYLVYHSFIFCTYHMHTYTE